MLIFNNEVLNCFHILSTPNKIITYLYTLLNGFYLLKFMLYKLWKNKDIDKIGLSIIIDNLPDCYNRKNEVIKHELQFWDKLYDKDMYDAPVDTTFALYRKNKLGPAGYIKSVRMKPPFSIKHLPWYEDTSNPTNENLYYIENSKTRTHWTDSIK